MLMPDVNILIYAHRSDESVHLFYRQWLERTINGPQPFALSVLVAVAFVRIVTNKKFSKSATPLLQALAVIDELRKHPNCRLLSPGVEHWDLVRTLCHRTDLTGSSISDAQHAAVAIEHGCTWISRDTDFEVFSRYGLRWEHLTP